MELNGAIPGDAPALVEVEITPSGGAAAPIWALIGWSPRPGAYNQCWNGAFENVDLGVGGWTRFAVTNINALATSITRITTAAKYGFCSMQIVAPATADAGANFRIFRRFKKGVTYTAEAWIHSAAGVTNTYIRLGNGAANDKASSGNTALSPTWQRITVTWVPTADRDDAYVAVNIAAATGTTYEIDGVMVYEGTTAPTSPNQSEGRGGYPPVGILEGEAGTGVPIGNANFRSGFGTPTTLPQYVIDPALLVPDDYTQSEVAIEVWGRFEIVSTDWPVMKIYTLPLGGGVAQYTEEFGSAGTTMTLPSAGTVRRFVRLGTLRFATHLGLYKIVVAGASPTPDLDYLLLVPSRSRALSPSRKANDPTFPTFVSSTAELTKRIRSDLSATVQEPNVPETPTSGLGGSLLEFPPGDVDTVVKLSSLVPDDPTSNTTDEQLAHSATVHFRVTPRWHLGRSS
jgi:hypothetical protein